ncbi:MAG: BadF/BadG/BcrA/BcrD ATPase family protein [Pseudomonadota bacterium]
MKGISNHNPDALFIGIDGGGTKCRARLVSSDEKLLGIGVGGPANPLHGQEQTKASILQSVEMALAQAGLPKSDMGRLLVGIGLAGVNLPSMYEVMKAWQHPFKRMYLTTDLHIACLGAHSRDQGAIIIAGTGSCGYSFVNNKVTIIGGHGFPFGDKGSGAWMGLEAVKAVLLASDNLGSCSLLSDLIGNHLQAKGVMIVDRMGAAKASDYAQLAGFVLDAADAKDEVAEKIVREGANYLSAVAEKLWETKPGSMSFIGGLSERLIPWLNADVAEGLSVPINQPEFGAIYYARQQENLLVC